MNIFLRNTISKLYNAVSAPAVVTRDALSERLQSACDTASSLYNRMMENMGHGQQERLKDIVEKEAEEEQLAAVKEEDEEDSTNLTTHENEEDGYTRMEMAFNSPMTEFFEGSDISDLIERMLAHIKTQIENPQMPGGGFSLDKMKHLPIKFDPCPGQRVYDASSRQSLFPFLQWHKC